jgi:hypothetical protein
VLGQPETPERALRIDPNDLVRAQARVDRKEDGDQPPHDMGVAVALEAEARRGPGGDAIDLGRKPDLTGAAANFVRLRSPLSGLGYLPRDIIISWLCSDNQHGRVEIASLSRNAAKIDLDFGSCLDCAFQKARRVVIGINLNSSSSQRKDAAFTNGAWPS